MTLASVHLAIKGKQHAWQAYFVFLLKLIQIWDYTNCHTAQISDQEMMGLIKAYQKI